MTITTPDELFFWLSLLLTSIALILLARADYSEWSRQKRIERIKENREKVSALIDQNPIPSDPIPDFPKMPPGEELPVLRGSPQELALATPPIPGVDTLSPKAQAAMDQLFTEAARDRRKAAIDAKAAETLADLRKLRRMQQADSLIDTMREESDYITDIYGENRKK